MIVTLVIKTMIITVTSISIKMKIKKPIFTIEDSVIKVANGYLMTINMR